MSVKLFDSELKVMKVLWRDGDSTAKHIAEVLKDEAQWSKTTVYTVIKKCIDKGAVTRTDPNYVCHAVFTDHEIREYETNELINKMYDGSGDLLVSALVNGNILSRSEIQRLKELVEKLD